MDLEKKAIKGVGWSALEKWGGQTISLLTFLALSRLLNPEDFGLIAFATVFIAFSQVFLDQGFSAAIVQREGLEQDHLNTAFWTSMMMGLILMIVMTSLANWIAVIFGYIQLTGFLRWMSPVFILAALSSTQQAILQRQLAFNKLAKRSLIAVVSGGSIGVGSALLGLGVWSLVLQMLTTHAVGAIVLWRVSDWQPEFKFSRSHFEELFTFGINIVGSRALDFFNRRADDFLIGYFLGPVALGYYVVAYRFLQVMIKLLTGVTNTVAFPAFSRLQDEPMRMRKSFYTVTQYTSLVAFPVFLGMAVLAPEIVQVVFGSKWSPSVPVMQVLGFIGVLHSVLYFNGSVILAKGKSSWRLGLMLINAVGNVLAFALVVQWGIVAVATSYVLVGYLLSPLSFWAIRSLIQIDFKEYFEQFKAPITGSLAMVAVILGLKYWLSQTVVMPLQLVIYTVCGAVTYFWLIRLTSPSLSEKIKRLVLINFPGLSKGKA